MKALVVDDSSVMRKVIIGALERIGITDIDEAEDGQQAVDSVAEVEYDIILLDWYMPNMLGIDALISIRKSGNTMPILMVTSESEKSRVVEALKAGANNYIIKPFEPGTIVTQIQETVSMYFK